MEQAATHNIKRNTLINMLGAVVPLAVLLLTVPIYLTQIGQARYGVMAIVWLLLSYFGVFDMGLGRAVAHQVARLRGAPAHETETLFWTALLLNGSLGALGGVLLWGLGQVLLGGVFKMPAELRPEALAALPWLVAAVPLVTITSVLVGVLEGRERFLMLNVLGVTGTVLFQLAPLAVAFWHGPELAWLIGAAVIARLFSVVLLLLACRNVVPLVSLPRFERARVGTLFRFGGWITLTGVIGPLMSLLDDLVIGAQAGVQAVAYYTIPSNLVAQMAILPNSLSRTLFPRFAMLRSADAREVGHAALLALAAIVTPAVALALVAIRPFLTVWVGAEAAANAAPVGEILLLGAWFNCLAYIPFTLLQGQGRPDLPAKFHVAELPPYLLALWLGLVLGGLPGAAWAWTLRVALDALLLFGAARLSWRRVFSIVPALVIVLLTCAGMLVLFSNPLWRIAIGGLLVSGALIWSWHVAADQIKALLRQLPGFRTAVKVS